MNDESVDLLSPPPGERLVNWAFLAAALRRRRRAIFAAAAAGLVLGLGLAVLGPKAPVAHSTVLLQYGDNVDPTRAMATDVQLLQTQAVAKAAAQSLDLNVKPQDFLAKFHGTVLSDSILQISASGPSPAEATRRAAAVTDAFLAFRAQVYQNQLSLKIKALQVQQSALTRQLAQTTDTTTAVGLNTLIQNIEQQIQNAQVATNSVVKGSGVVDPATSPALQGKKKAIQAGITGLIAGAAVAILVVILFALASTRVRRRADIAELMRAPVAVSVGRVIPRGWRRLVPRRTPAADHPDADLQLIGRHLQSLLSSASARALVIVSVDNLPVATLAVQTLERRLVANGRRVSIVNATDRAMPETVQAIDAATDRDIDERDDVVLVLAVLDPAKGAEHLREWSADAVAFVTAGRSTAAKLDANAAMIRSAALRLRSVVLIGADATDDSLGIYDEPAASDARLHTVEAESAPSATRPALP